MKNLGFIAVVALLMMFGCSKDDLITTEQELFSVEKNNQPVIYDEKGPIKDNAGVGTGFWLKGTSSDSDESLPIYFSSESAEMKILSHGNFSGKLIGYGKINEIESYYDIKILSVIDNKTVDYTRCWGQYIYNLEIKGTVYIIDRASSFFTFSLTGEFHTNHDLYTINQVYVGGANELNGDITYREGKFLSFDKPLYGSVWCDDLTTGMINLRIK